MADRDPEVMRALVRLMSNLEDLSDLDDDEIVTAIREARDGRVTAQQRGAAELRERGWSYRQIAKALGVNQAQPLRWLQGVVPQDTDDEPEH